MKKLILSIIIFATFFQSNIQAQDQNDLDNITLKLISTKTPGIEIVEDFHSTASRHFHDPKAPRFLLYDQQRKIAFGVGGFVRVRTAYDFAGSPTNSFGFIPYSIPVPTDPLTKNNFRMDPSKSTLFFKLLGNNSQIGKFHAYVSGSFTGNNNSFILDDAYISFLGFTIGRTWSTFNDLAAVPPTVDFQGPNGAAEMRTTQISYSHNLTKKFSFAIAAELPQTTGTYDPLKTAETTQRIPDVPAYIQYNWGKGAASHLRVAGVMRNINYRDLISNKTETATGYGVQLSSNILINPLVEFYGQVTYGKGIAQYINDLSGNGLSLVKDPIKEGKMNPQEALGWFAQVKFNLTQSLFTSLGYSQAKVFPESGVAGNTQYRYGQYAVGNIFYNIGSDFQLGLEYLWGNRVNIGGEKASANCIQSVIQFNF